VGQFPSAQGAGGFQSFAGIRAAARFALAAALLASLTLAISGCGGDKSAGLGDRVIALGQPVPKGGGRYHVGKPYQVSGLWYRPHEDPSYDRTGRASWYGELFHGRRTANGEIYDMNRLTAAHPTLPLPVYAQVTNLDNGKTIVVRINDRGPFAHDRIIDLSRRSAEKLGFRHRGTAPVRVRYLRRAPLNGDDSYERRYASQGTYQFSDSLEAGAQTGGARDPIAVASLLAQDTPPLSDRVVRPRAVAALPAPASSGTKRWDDRAMLIGKSEIKASPELTGSTSLPVQSKSQRLSSQKGPAIQAGSFRIKDNAERARVTLSAIAPVEVARIESRGKVYFRVRVGPFADETDAEAALPRVTAAGYRDAKIVMRN
jgi:rare lipoprotein A